MQFVETAEFPLVFKLSVGAGSANILKIENKEEAIRVTESMFGEGFKPYSVNEFEKMNISGYPISYQEVKNEINYPKNEMVPETKPIITQTHWYYLIQKNYVYFQEFLPDNKFDIRVTIIGNRAFAFIRYNRSNDFRASGSGKIVYDLNKIPLDAVETAHRISRENNFQSMAYDFLFDKTGKAVISEISYCFQNLAVFNCSGFWDRDLNWHEGHIWPERAQITDFVHYIKNGVVV